MSILPPHDPRPDDQPRPLTLGPTVAGALAAFAFGSLTLGSLCAAASNPAGAMSIGVFWLAIAAIWVAMAACIYAANQAWVGRDREERVLAFLLCLGLALIVFAVAFLVVAYVATSLGWWH